VSHLPPEETIAELYSAALAFANGSRQRDDLTAVVIKRVPAVAELLDRYGNARRVKQISATTATRPQKKLPLEEFQPTTQIKLLLKDLQLQ